MSCRSCLIYRLYIISLLHAFKMYCILSYFYWLYIDVLPYGVIIIIIITIKNNCSHSTLRHAGLHAGVLSICMTNLNSWHATGNCRQSCQHYHRQCCKYHGCVRLTVWKHLPCFAHTLNLVVHSGMAAIKPLHDKVKAIVEYFHKSSERWGKSD